MIDGATGVNDQDDTPSPGDPTVCFYCNELLVFTRKLRVRRPTEQEREKLMQGKTGDIIRSAMKTVVHIQGRH